MALAAALKRFVAWFWDACLPLWAERGVDAAGGFHESLDFNGRPVVDEPRRVRVQARQVHVFATAARLGRHPRAEGIAHAGFDYFLKRACPDGGQRGCAHRLSPDGSILDQRRDLYDQAFLLLACASMIRSFGEGRAARLAALTLRFLNTELKSPHGGYFEDDLRRNPRRQNPHMHLYEAFTALHAATGDASYRERALEIEFLLGNIFFDRRLIALREYFTDDLKPMPGEAGEILEPGHMAEWAWLLDRSDDKHLQQLLYRRAVGLGERDGFLVNAVCTGEAPGGPRRLWPQTELLKASLVMLRRGEKDAAANAACVLDGLFATYLHQSVNGLWCDEYDDEGRPIAKSVPASIVYHLMEAALETERHLRDPQ